MNENRWYDAEDTNIYQTDGYSGSDADVNNTEKFTDDIDLTYDLGASVDFKFDASGTTDDLTLSLYKRRDATWDGDEIAIWSATISSDGSEDIYHFTISEAYGAGHFRFGMASSGATDTFEVNANYRAWRKTDRIA